MTIWRVRALGGSRRSGSRSPSRPHCGHDEDERDQGERRGGDEGVGGPGGERCGLRLAGAARRTCEHRNEDRDAERRAPKASV